MEVQVGRFASLLRQLLVLRADNPLPDVSEEIVAAIILEGPRIEYDALGGTIPWTIWAFQAAVAGQNPHLLFFNPTDSRTLVVAEKILCVSSALSTIITVGRRTTEFVGNPTQELSDARDMRTIPPTMDSFPSMNVTGTNSAAAVGGEQTYGDMTLVMQGGALAWHEYRGGEIVIARGEGLLLSGTAIGSGIQATVGFRERPIERTEFLQRRG